MADLRTRRTFDRCEPIGTFGLTRKSWRPDRVLICLTSSSTGTRASKYNQTRNKPTHNKEHIKICDIGG